MKPSPPAVLSLQGPVETGLVMEKQGAYALNVGLYAAGLLRNQFRSMLWELSPQRSLRKHVSIGATVAK